MKRREFIALAGGAVAWPTAIQAQQQPVPVLGVLLGVSAKGFEGRIRAFSQGLRDGGYLEAQNLRVEYRWAENRTDRLPVLAAELVERKVAVIVALGGPASAVAAKAATATIPIVFGIPDDPIRLGLVASLARPGGNVTGVNFLAGELMAKRFELMRMLNPSLSQIAVLINSGNAGRAEGQIAEIEKIESVLGIRSRKFRIETGNDIDAAFATFAPQKPDAIFIAPAPFFISERAQIAGLAARHGVPTFYSDRTNVEAGGLMSYGTNINDSYRQTGLYAARVLGGEKPAELPVVLPTRYELVINLKAAKALGLSIPDKLMVLADEVIE